MEPPDDHSELESIPTKQEDFERGDWVHVKAYGRATVIELLQQDPQKAFHNRLQVQYPDGKTYWARPSNLRRIVLPTKRVITAETTREYREACMYYVNPEDICLEVGCHEGVTTAMLHGRCQMAVGVDLSETTIERAKAKFPHVRFENLDGCDIDALKALSPSGQYDKVMLDIGGIADLPAVMQLVGLYYRTWKKATLIVKSVFFTRLLEDAEVYHGSCTSSSAFKAAAERQRLRERDNPSL